MRTKRPDLALLTGALAATCALASVAEAQVQDPYHATLHFGTGLINIPVAWVSPNSLDGWFTISGKDLPSWPEPDKNTFGSRVNSNVSLDTHLFGRLSLGVSAYSQNPEWGFFGQALLLKDNQFGFLPALAVGARNIGKYNHEDRFLIGHDISLQGGGQYDETVPERYANFETAPTLFAVATKNMLLGSMGGRLPAASMSLSLGFGNGLFHDDGDLGEAYNRRGTVVRGLFFGTRFVTHPSLNTTLTLLAENDAWDYNAGLIYDWRGLSLGVYATELEEGRRNSSGFFVYNYTKLNMAIGYTGNVIDVSRGVLLRTRITQLTREQQRLRIEIAARERRIRGLEVSLRKAQAGELANIEQRRRTLEQQVQEERDAIRQAEERLRRIERGEEPALPSQPPQGQSQGQPQSQQPAPSEPPAQSQSPQPAPSQPAPTPPQWNTTPPTF